MLIKGKHTLLLVLLLFCAQLVAGNPDGFAVYGKSTFSFRYDPADGRSLENFFIKEMAKYNYLELYKTNYNLSYEHVVNFRELAGRNYEITSSVTLKSMDGDIFYEGFDISGVLRPSTYNFDISVYGKDLSLINVLHFKDLAIKGTNQEVIYSMEIPVQTELIYKVNNTGFKYLETDKAEFTQRIEQVNDFLGFLDLSEKMVKKADFINPDEEKTILVNFLKIYDLERFSKIIAKQNFDPDLQIPAKEATLYAKNLSTHSVNQRRLKTIYEQNVDTLNKEIGEAEVAAAASEIVNLQLGYLKSLSLSNYMFQPVYQQMAEMIKNDQSWKFLIDEIVTFFSTRKNIVFQPGFEGYFGQQLYLAALDATDSLLIQQNYNEAVFLLETASAVCNYQPQHDCDLEVFHRLSKAKYGIYSSFIKIADQSLQKRNLELAKNYLEQAKDFQTANRSMIISDELTNEYFGKLANEFLQRGRQASKDGFYIEALNDLSRAKGIYQQLNRNDVAAQCENEMKNAFDLKFLELAKKSEKVLEDGNPDQADHFLAQIQVLANQYPEVKFDKRTFENLQTNIRKARFENQLNSLKTALKTENLDQAAILLRLLKGDFAEDFKKSDREITGYFQEYLKPVMLQKISAVEALLRVGQRNEAELKYAGIVKLRHNYPDFRDKEVDEAFADLMKSFESEECTHLKGNIADETDRAIKFIEVKKFTEAQQIISQALRDVNSLKDCKISDSTLQALQTEYADIFAYYQLLNQADEKFGKSDYLASIEMHLKAEKFFYEKNISRFGETYQPIEEFIISKSSPGLNSTAIGYYSRKQDYRKMISLFHVYLQNGYDIAKYDAYLAEGGTSMATYDKERFPQNDPVFMLEKLTLGKQDFQPFKSAYLKTWKNKK
jgi:hypothetical protein